MSQQKCESDYNFANVSATKAPIFMKFETKVDTIVINDQLIFYKYLCAHPRTRGVNVRARFVATVVLSYLINLSFKFHEDRSFRCRDICKIVITFTFLLTHPLHDSYRYRYCSNLHTNTDTNTVIGIGMIPI